MTSAPNSKLALLTPMFSPSANDQSYWALASNAWMQASEGLFYFGGRFVVPLNPQEWQSSTCYVYEEDKYANQADPFWKKCVKIFAIATGVAPALALAQKMQLRKRYTFVVLPKNADYFIPPIWRKKPDHNQPTPLDQNFEKELDRCGIDVKSLEADQEINALVPVEIRNYLERFYKSRVPHLSLTERIEAALFSTIDQKEKDILELWDLLSHGKYELEIIQTFAKKYPRVLSSLVLKGTTPLHLAVLTRRADTVEFLLNNKLALNVPTDPLTAITAAHLAAIFPDFKILKILKEHGANFTLKNAANADVFDILKTRGYAKLPLLKIQPFLDDRRLDLDEYHEELNTRYLPDNFFSANNTFKALLSASYDKEAIESTTNDNSIFLEKYRQIKKKISTGAICPPFYLNKLEYKDDGTPVPEWMKGQYECKARTEIPEGEVVGEYTGLSDERYNRSLTTSLDKAVQLPHFPINIDSQEGGSILEFINYGPPNCSMHLIIYKGFPRLILVAARKIKKHESLYWDYANEKYWKNQGIKPVELAPLALSDYLITQTKNMTSFNFYLDENTRAILTKKNNWLMQTSQLTRKNPLWNINNEYQFMMFAYIRINFENACKTPKNHEALRNFIEMLSHQFDDSRFLQAANIKKEELPELSRLLNE
ncbi:MAG: SET domain-containing protein-lysine N-methyltransferase [Anaerolineae bacterium]